ncbi:MAG: hypothetical protein IPI12_08195 [Ignavibacteriales bacterium]|jgi:hypothetical protein|nr:hypothetical protein [Ignavibacteriales bacterium]MBP7543228.1 hypothetical protein [Ignavibacteriaceae bacterium]MBP9123650.1 hypothetical protein [Ignavibacteriaceae bacterium]
MNIQTPEPWDIKKGDYKRDFSETNRFLRQQERNRKIRQTILLAGSVTLLFGILYGIFYIMTE